MANLEMPTQWGSGKCIHERRIYLDGSKTPTMHTIDVWTPSVPSLKTKRFWIIYIHGGAWRVGNQLNFVPTLRNMLESSSLEHIAGFASINYRLSTYPNRPETANDPNRNVQHPEHLSDVMSAIAFLNNRYAIGSDYLLMGHSCGATLAFQVDQRSWHGPAGWELPQAAAVLGVEGIYDFDALVKNHSDETMYEDFIIRAFGADRKAWTLASPTTSPGSKAWMAAKVVAISHSDEDELVETEQANLMLKVLKAMPTDKARGFGTTWSEENRKDVYIEMSGKHEEIWERGTMDRAIETVLALLIK